MKDILLELIELKVATQQFKPYETTFAPHSQLCVRVSVPDNCVDEMSPVVTLNLHGVTFIARVIADAFETMSVDRTMGIDIKPKGE